MMADTYRMSLHATHDRGQWERDCGSAARAGESTPLIPERDDTPSAAGILSPRSKKHQRHPQRMGARGATRGAGLHKSEPTSTPAPLTASCSTPATAPLPSSLFAIQWRTTCKQTARSAQQRLHTAVLPRIARGQNGRKHRTACSSCSRSGCATT